jgi:hypothetical protein
MTQFAPKLAKDIEEIIVKFGRLIQAASTLHDVSGEHEIDKLCRFSEVRASALNLLSRLGSVNSIYYRELERADFTDHLALRGILQAALTDYREGFMVDHALLISGEVFTDLLVQAEVLLENDFKDAGAVIIRAVLEDGLRRLCHSHDFEVEPRDTISSLNDRLYRGRIYTALQQKEITAKAQIGNDAAHARWDKYKREDVAAFPEFVRRFLAEFLR